MKSQDNGSSLASGNTLHDSTMETSSKLHDPGTRRPRQSGSKERKQCVRQSRRKNTDEMSKSESMIEEKDYLQTWAVSPFTLIASKHRNWGHRTISIVSTNWKPTISKSFSICSILSQLSLKDLQTRMVYMETHLAILRDGIKKMQANNRWNQGCHITNGTDSSGWIRNRRRVCSILLRTQPPAQCCKTTGNQRATWLLKHSVINIRIILFFFFFPDWVDSFLEWGKGQTIFWNSITQ